MANEVYANGMELACKAGAGKTICAMPDVCFTPPENPATPPGVPVPYPNTGLASDTSDGSKTVQISGKEIMLKNKSYFKKSTGDEAGCAAKKGVISSKNTGKVYFVKWSMDVKFEGENVDRHLDMTTDNHASPAANEAIPWPFIDSAAFDGTGPCKDLAKSIKDNCPKAPKIRGRKAWIKAMCDKPDPSPCRDAMKCALSPYAPRAEHADGKTTQGNCCPGKTPHHLVEVHCFAPINQRTNVMPEFANAKGKGYNLGKAPCICVDGPRDDKKHGEFHAVQQQIEAAYNQRTFASKTPMSGGGQSNWTYGEARDAGLEAMAIAMPDCDPGCTKAQIDSYHTKKPPNGPGVSDDTPVRSDLGADGRSVGTLNNAQQASLGRRLLLVLARGFP